MPGSENTLVAVIGGSGLKGMRAAEANKYSAGGSGFPDFMISSLNMVNSDSKDLKMLYFMND